MPPAAMDHQSIVLRKAAPTFDEGLEFARFLDTAAEGFFGFLLGRDSEAIVAKTFLQPNNDYSYENVLFAESQGKIVGMAAGYTAERRHGFARNPLAESAGKAAARLAIIGFFLHPLFRILETVPDGDYYLLSIATNKEARGKGIGSGLMDSIEKRAGTAGSARISLDVSSKNEDAKRFYERRGMTVQSEWPSLPIIPPVFLRMTKDL